jgi:3-phosphoshikimate 1-carboxyvinyltransferase
MSLILSRLLRTPDDTQGPSLPLEARLDRLKEPILPSKLEVKIVADHTQDPERLMKLGYSRCEFVDLPHTAGVEFFSSFRKKFPEKKLIVSYHNDERTPKDLDELFYTLKSYPAEVIKIATFAHSCLDGLRMLKLLKTRAKEASFVAFCTGEKGIFSRILQPVFGGMWTYAYEEGRSPTGSSQLSSVELKNIYHYDLLGPSTKVYALIGDPVDQSPSHSTHNALFRSFFYDGVYVKIPCTKEEVDCALDLMEELQFRALSITRPLKFAFSQDEPYNTLLFEKGRRLLFNTDGPAALDAIEEKMAPCGASCLVVGAGGVGMAIAKEAKAKGAKVFLSSRSKEDLHRRAHLLGCSVFEGDGDFDIVINATQDDISPQCHIKKLALDVRLGGESSLLDRAKSSRLATICGEDLWVRQAAKQLALWLHPKALLCLPPSKSQTLRAILFATFAKGLSIIRNPLASPDTEAMIEACGALGATIVREGDELQIRGIGTRRETGKKEINAGGSGITLRFIAACAALFREPISIIGDESMIERRNCLPLLEALLQLGAKAASKNGHVPLSVSGPIASGRCCLDGRDSQPVSALLIATSLLSGVSHIEVKNPGEKPWVLLTIEWLRRLGVKVEMDNFSHFSVVGLGRAFPPFVYEVEKDLSSLAYLVAAALLRPVHVIIEGVDLSSHLPDKKVLSILCEMGARFDYDEKVKRLSVKGPQILHGGSFDMDDCIDMVTILAALGCFAESPLHLHNASSARDKESDRLSRMREELSKMGALVEETSDGLIIKKSTLHSARLSSHNDHRVAMALQVAGFGAGIDCTIEGKECVEKSFPSFFEQFEKIQKCTLSSADFRE